MIKMRLFIAFSCLIATMSCIAQDQDVQVGKHVSSSTDPSNMIISLFIVLVIIIGCAVILKRFQSSPQGVSGLKIVASLTLGTKERIVVVQVGQKQLLLGVTSQQVTLLESLEHPLEEGAKFSSEFGQSFKALIKNTTTKKQV